MLLAFGFSTSAVLAQDRAQLLATQEDGYGRLVLTFPDRLDLPEHTVRSDNGVVSVEFSEQVSVALPDVAATLPRYVSVARVDPDGEGLRVALRTDLNFNAIAAGERLFIDLLPPDWQGVPPGLPQEVIDELAERARLAAIEAERERKARGALDLDPEATLRIGRNPTFTRIQFDWTVPTAANYVQDAELGLLAFEWPVDIDLRALEVDLPEQILAVESEVTVDGALVHLELAEGVTPRFYAVSPTQAVLDIDGPDSRPPQISVASLAAQADARAEAALADAAPSDPIVDALRAEPSAPILPFVTTVGSTVRVVFPFETDVASAVFQRGDTVWMLFDTAIGIKVPDDITALETIADGIDVMSSGDAQVVRIHLSQERLATLGSEGRAWVLSLGDMLLSPTEPITLERRLDTQGAFEITADMRHPVRVHQFLDPVVGDMLEIVTAYPPARGVTRPFSFVDFTALRSVHGLVVKPRHDGVAVGIDGQLAVMKAENGLILSADRGSRDLSEDGTTARTSFVDLAALTAADPGAFNEATQTLAAAAAEAEGADRDIARLDLAQHYLANGYSYEAIGVLGLVGEDLQSDAVSRRLWLSRAIANTLAHRPEDALQALTSPLLLDEIDALVWRTMARAEAHDYQGARRDALQAFPVIESYPAWVQSGFLLAGARAAVETGDPMLGRELLSEIDFGMLTVDENSLFHLLTGRIEELEGSPDSALVTYGNVIAADVRPTRAEAVLRTLAILKAAGTLDLAKATETLAAEAMLWRGGPLEAEMQAMLAELYFDDGKYRDGFETVRLVAARATDGDGPLALQDRAQETFADLFLNGRADALPPIEALGLYYDYRELTPPGTRGDEMIRNLAQRLVSVDLLGQAAELLHYQVENRLTGAARAQIAADLAVIYLADHQADQALTLLNETRLPNLSASLTRQRRVLEARALIDVGRDELGLDMLREMSGRDVDLLRIEASWKAGRYAEAGAMLEAMHAGDPDGTLQEIDRMGIVKAAVGYVLANDAFGLTRLRQKYGERLVTTPQWALFDFVTSPVEPTSLEFRKVARDVAGKDSLDAFLMAYRQTYQGSGALTPLQGTSGADDLASL
jgi:hypothetical protein